MVTFEDEQEDSVPMSTDRTSDAYNKIDESSDSKKFFEIEEAIKELSINQSKLKRIFNYHVKNTHNKIDFSEFLKFCKSTQIFPNFISIINLKKIIQQIISTGKDGKGKKGNTMNSKSVTNNTMITFKEFNRSLKKMAQYTLENSAEAAAAEKIQVCK